MTRLAAQRIVRKDGDEHDSRLVRLSITQRSRSRPSLLRQVTALRPFGA